MNPELDEPGVRPVSLWQAPLVPVALAATAGVVLDRFAEVPLAVSLVAVVAALAAWAVTRGSRRTGLPLLYLAGAVLALAAAYHHWHRDVYPEDDIGSFASAQPRPVRLRGVLIEEPAVTRQAADEPLRSYPPRDSAHAVLKVTAIHGRDDLVAATGRARLTAAAPLFGLHVGDEVEVVGRLQAPRGPANPGEFDHADHLRDQRIRAEVSVHTTPDGVTRLSEGWPGSLFGWLAVVRGWGRRVLQDSLPPEQTGVAEALLLGEGSSMTGSEWDKYIRTGVIHVLAISGQHLVVLAVFLWSILWLCGVRRRRAAWIVALLLLAYALLAGGRPPVLRSAITVCVVCGGLILRRPALPANSFALAWLIVLALNPTDIFTAGCQLSFLAVAVLYWGTSRWFRARPDPLTGLMTADLPAWRLFLRWLVRTVLLSYAVTLAIWLTVTPLVAWRQHIVAPVGILLSPPMVLLSSIALVAGFLLLLSAAICWPLVPVFAWVTSQSLAGCEALVSFGDRLAGGHWYVGTIPTWWLWVFYLALLAVLMLEPLQKRWRWAAPAGLAWLCVGLVSGSARPASDELRCTFLAVGHGGCTVLETADGRAILYDAGAMSGPDVTQRQIAPFLWSRGIRRLDEVIISHADLDHFNGLPALLERFAVGQITCTPTFADKSTPGVRVTLQAIEEFGIPMRIVRAGDVLSAGDVTMEALHPPPVGPEGNENARSLVLLVRHAEHTLLLTGDLEGPGLARLLSLPPMRIDVLMAPHHGSRLANTPELAKWAQPKVALACQGPPVWPVRTPNSYTALGAHYFGTWPHGAVTVRSHTSGLIVETFRTKERLVVR